MKDNNFITIQGWMRNQLGLVGNELIVYAIIYGFCQDGKSSFTGCARYIADWIGITKDGTYAILKKLTAKKFIIKSDKNINGVALVDYSINYDVIPDSLPKKVSIGNEESSVGGAEESSVGGAEESSVHNNIIYNNNIKNNRESIYNNPRTEFCPPTLRQVIDYAHMMDDTAGMGGFHCTRQMAEEFWSHYTANGWVVSNEHRTPIVDWQAKFRQWAIQEKKNNKDDIPDGPVTLNP